LLTGTPVRPELWKPFDTASARRELGLAPDKPTVLVFGGSQGARALNEIVPAALAASADRCGVGLQVLHLAGARGTEIATAAYARAGGGLSVKVLPYLEAMERGYAAADLVICRSGASTLAELALLRKPALLIPFPHATANHQEANARLLADTGAVRLVPERELASRLAGQLSDLLSFLTSPERLLEMARGFDRLALPTGPEAVAHLTEAVETLARQ
jgi:UDP-N-acetylglucosamine--N-acetylmuramyl-(pentapeptide) pyrophosphoryl-undecaprenol N-acetylglucosamine transferase